MTGRPFKTKEAIDRHRKRVRLKIESRIPAQASFWEDRTRNRAYVGGVGSGKTTAGVVELLRQPAGTTGIVVAPTYPMLRDATMRTFFELVPDRLIREHNRAENRVELANGTTLLFRSGDRPDRLRGPNVGFAYLDEAAYLDEDVFKVIVGRLRRRPGRLWLTTTPRGQNWVYRRFVTNATESHSLHTGKTADNPYLPDDFVDELSKEFGDTAYARQELEGQFVDLSGVKRFAGDLLAAVFDDQPAMIRAVPGEVGGYTVSTAHSRIYEIPDAALEYAIGVDPAEGVPGGDDSAVVVVERSTGRLCCVVSGELEPTEELGANIALVSKWYNNASPMVERNNHGHATIASLRRYGVAVRSGADGRSGYLTTSASKAQLFDVVQRRLLDARADGEKILVDLRLKEQIASIERLTLRAIGKSRKSKVDDEAIAWSLAQFSRAGGSVASGRAAMLKMFGGR